MHKLPFAIAAILVLSSAAAEDAAVPAAPAHTLVQADAIAWGPAPAGLPPGSSAAVLSGNPGAEGVYTIRAKMPDGYRIQPHWHPSAEYVTVLSGTLHVGMGDVFDKTKATALHAGAYADLPAKMSHWVWTEGETILQIHGVGPFAITYIDPADDPRAAPAAPEPAN